MSSSTDTKLVANVKEALALVRLCAGIGYLSKTIFRKNFTDDPSASLMNAGEFSLVMLGALYARDYLVEQKIIPQRALQKMNGCL